MKSPEKLLQFCRIRGGFTAQDFRDHFVQRKYKNAHRVKAAAGTRP
jgi:hypothetical protein